MVDNSRLPPGTQHALVEQERQTLGPDGDVDRQVRVAGHAGEDAPVVDLQGARQRVGGVGEVVDKREGGAAAGADRVGRVAVEVGDGPGGEGGAGVGVGGGGEEGEEEGRGGHG